MKQWFHERLSACDPKRFNTSLSIEGKDYGRDFLQFDGNPQTLRLLTQLQAVSDTYGLNLTAGTLSAASKYTADCWEVTPSGWHERSKLGYFQSEAQLVSAVGEETGTSGRRNPIAIIVEAADDITYSTVDLEDGVRKQTLTWADMVAALARYDAGEYSDFDALVAEVTHYVNTGGLALSGSARDEAYIQMFRAFAIGRHVTAAAKAFTDNYDSIMRGNFHSELVKISDSAPLLKSAKKVGAEYVYRAANTLKLEVRGRRIIHDLMDVFWEGVKDAPCRDSTFLRSFSGKVYSLMSPNYRDLFERAIQCAGRSLPEDYLRLRLVGDYMAGMTDTFALTLHRELCGG